MVVASAVNESSSPKNVHRSGYVYMSKVTLLKTDYLNKPNLKQANHASKQSFEKGLSDLPKEAQDILVKGVSAKIDKRMGWVGRPLKWLSDTKGELQSQLINAAFTTTLAPIMIAYNPFSKQDEKTKKYTALRQPISAGIALSVVLPMTWAINSFMDNLYNVGHFETIDLRLDPSKGYLKHAYKLTGGKKSAFNDYAEKIKKERMEFFTTLITEDPDNIIFDEKSKAILVKGKDLKSTQPLKIPNFETKQDLDKYLEANNLHKRTFDKFLTERFGFEFYESGQLKPQVTDSKLSQIKAIDFLKETGLIEDTVTENELRKVLGVFQQSRKVKEMEQIFKNSNVELKEDSAKKLLEIIGKISTRVTQINVGERIGKAKATTLGQFLHQLGYYDSKVHATDKTLQGLVSKPMAEVLEEFASHFKGHMKGFNDKAELKDFAKNILKNSAKRMAENAKNYKNYTGIAFNLITTAVGCTILNWAYPRIMEKFFPHLTKSDEKTEKVEGGNK